MIKAILNNKAAIPLASAMILLGIISLVASATTTAVQFFHFLNSGTNVTVPAQDIRVEVEPGKPYAVFHRITGSHITTNRPISDLPDDYTISIIDAQTTEPVEHEQLTWYMQNSFFGHRSKRKGVVSFTSPDSGVIEFSADGFDQEKVFYIGRSHEVFMDEIMPYFIAWIGGSLLIMILGAAIIMYQMVQAGQNLSINTHNQ